MLIKKNIIRLLKIKLRFINGQTVNISIFCYIIHCNCNLKFTYTGNVTKQSASCSHLFYCNTLFRLVSRYRIIAPILFIQISKEEFDMEARKLLNSSTGNFYFS